MNRSNADQSEVQFLGEGSSHELAALLLTEAIQYSLFSSKQPLFALYLDAKSAFDSVLREFLVSSLYQCGTNGHSLLYINNRLQSRTTYIEWDKQLMGPIRDELGVEQGGVNSGDFYKIFGKRQLSDAQASGLGVPMGDTIISAIGDADDSVLLSNSLHSLQNLSQLSQHFCSEKHIELCVEKTKLQAFTTTNMAHNIAYFKLTSPVSIGGNKIEFVDSAEHVGVIRSVTGNLPNIMNRFIAHKRALGAVLHTGAARNHRGNPAASLRVEKLHGEPVLFSGMATLVLLKSEIEIIDQHHKVTLERLMRLHPRTPQCVVAFLAGSLPGTAIVHKKMLALFGMICRLPGNVLHTYATKVLVSSKPSSRSWFTNIRELCLQYGLPHPLFLLQYPGTKESFKNLTKKHIMDYWEIHLRQYAQSLSSLEYFHPNFMSLATPHPIWTTAGSSSYQISMASIQAIMLSGRYRTELLCSNWSSDTDGNCQAPSCKGSAQPEDLRHILAVCNSLAQVRVNLLSFTTKYCQKYPAIKPIIETYCSPTHPLFCQFLLDCSVLPDIIRARQVTGPDLMSHLFRVTRTWCYCIHKARLKTLNRWHKF